MSLELKEVRKVARLARIAIPEEKLDVYGNEINKILTWIEQLNKVDTSSTQPMASVIQGASTPLRDDVVHMNNNREDILKNAPKAVQGFYAVPKVVE